MADRRAARTPERDHAQRGLTLIELLVTIVLSGLFFAAMVPVFVLASQQGQTDRARVLATNAAQSTIEILRDLPYDDLYDTAWESPGSVAAIVDPQWKGDGSGIDVGVVPYPLNSAKGQERYLLVSVRAWWTREGGALRDVILRTAVYRRGLATHTLLLYVYPLYGERITTTPVTVAARLDAGDAFRTQRIDFEVWANNGTSIASWSVYSRETDPDRNGAPYARQDEDDGYWYYEQQWAAEGVADGTYTFLAKAVPLPATDPDYDPDYQGDRAQKQYVLDRVAPEKPTIEYCRAGFQLETPEGPSAPTVSLAWTLAANIGDAGSVEVYRTGVDATGVELAPKTIPILSRSATAYVDRDVLVGATYAYKVMVRDAVDQQGEWSDVASCTVPVLAEGEAPDAPPSPILTSVSGRSVMLSWSPSADRGVIDEYRVYRDAGLTTPIVSVPTYRSTSVDPYTYTDPTVEYGGTYTYFVTAVTYDEALDLYWESWSISAAPVHIPQPPVLNMRISIAVGTLPQGATRPTYARVAIHSMDTGDVIPANPWDYPTLKFVGSQKIWDTAAKSPYKADLYEGGYEVIAMFYSQTNQRLGTYTGYVDLTARDTPVVVTYRGPN